MGVTFRSGYSASPFFGSLSKLKTESKESAIEAESSLFSSSSKIIFELHRCFLPSAKTIGCKALRDFVWGRWSALCKQLVLAIRIRQHQKVVASNQLKRYYCARLRSRPEKPSDEPLVSTPCPAGTSSKNLTPMYCSLHGAYTKFFPHPKFK